MVLIVAGMRTDLVRSLVIIEPPAISLAKNSRPALELGRRLIDHFEKYQDMPNIKFARKILRTLGIRPLLPATGATVLFAMKARRLEQWIRGFV